MLTLGPFTPARKLNAGNLAPWRHHRGGWKFVCRLIAEHLYLFDMLDVLAELPWSWAAFAFRDAKWDAMNDELGADLHNMRPGKTSEFFARLKGHFQ
jgi:hypothetical protein